MSRRPLVEYAGEDLQSQALRRVIRSGGNYAPASRSEAITLANVFRRGWLDRERVDGRWVYSPRPDDAAQMQIPLALGAGPLEVVR